MLCQSQSAIHAAFEAEDQPYVVLADETRDVARAYGVHVALGIDSFNIARPATFVIDRERVVRWVFVASNQFEFPRDDSVHAAVAGARA